MAYTKHTLVTPIVPQDIADTMVGLLTLEMVLPHLFTRVPFADLRSDVDDPKVIKVPGRLVPRRYAWANDRSNPIVFDVYKEQKIQLTVADRIYSAVELTDEQRQFSLKSPDSLVPRQSEAVARGINTAVADLVAEAPYEWTIGGVSGAIRSALTEARKIMNKVGVPDASKRILVVGSDFEQAMLSEQDLTVASYTGDPKADAALTDATLGRVLGFRIVVDQTIPSDSAYALVPSAFVIGTGTPYIPEDVFGATASYDGYTLRWIKSYDHDHLMNKSSVDTYFGGTHTPDLFINPKQKIDQVQTVSTTTHFVRGVKLTLGGASKYPDPSSFLGQETGLTTAWAKP